MFEQLEEKIIKFRNERDWKQFHNPRTLATSVVIEAAELLELFQWVKDDELDQIAEQRIERDSVTSGL